MGNRFEKYEVFNLLPDYVSIKDLDFTFLWVNDALAESIGLPKEDIIGKKCYSVSYDRSTVCPQCLVNTVIQTMESGRSIVLFADGRIVDSIVEPIYENGELTYTLEISRDITEADITNNLFKSFMDSAIDNFSILDENLRYIAINDNALQQTGLSRDEILGKSIPELFPDAVESGRVELYRKVIETGDPVYIKEANGIRNNELKTFSIRAFKVGSGIGVIATDISDIKQMEQNLQVVSDALDETETQYQIFMNQSIDGIMLSISDQITFTNPRFREITGHSESDLLGTSVYSLIHPQYRDEVLDRMTRRRKGENFSELYELELIRKDGSTVPVEANVSLLSVSEEPAVLGFIREISERKKTERELIESKEKYQDLFDSLVDGFAYCKAIYDQNEKPIDFLYVEINEQYTEIFGKGPEIIGEKATDVWPGYKDDPDGFIVDYGELARYGGVLRFDRYTSTLDLWLRISAYSPRQGYFAVLYQDITLQKNLEQERQELQELYSTRLEALQSYNPLLFASKSILELANVTINLIKQILGFDRIAFLIVRDGMLEQIYGLPHVSFQIPLTGKGITVRCVNTSKPQLVLDVSKDPDYIEGETSPNAVPSQSELCVPVLENNETRAVINVESDTLAAFTENDQKILEIIADTVSRSWENIKSQELFNRRLNTIRQHTEELAHQLTVEGIAHTSVDAMEQVIGSEYITFQIVDGNNLRTIATEPPTEPILMPLDGPGLTVKAANTRKPVLVSDIKESTDFYEYEPDILSELAVPVVVEDITIAVLNVESKMKARFTEEDQQLMTIFAHDVGLALSRLSYYTELKQFQEHLTVLHRHAIELEKATTIDQIIEISGQAIMETLDYSLYDISVIEDDHLFAYLPSYDGQKVHISKTGIVPRAARTQQTQYVNDTEKDPDYNTGFHGTSYRSEIAVPVVSNDKTVAVLNIESEEPNAYTLHDKELLETLASHISSAFDRINQIEILENRIQERTLQLQETEFKYQSVIDATNVYLYEYDFLTKRLWLSDSAYDSLEIDKSSKLNLDEVLSNLFNQIHEEDLEIARQGFEKSFYHRQPSELVYREDDDGRSGYRWRRDRIDIEKDSQGVPVKLKGISFDTTEVKQLQDQLEEQNRQLIKLDEMRSQFINTAAHELRTPVTVIKGFLELISLNSLGTIPDNIQRMLETVTRNSERLASLTDDLLDVQRIDTGRLELNLEPTNVTELITAACHELETNVTESKLECHAILEELPIALVDRVRLTQVMINIIWNAIKFTPENGTISVSSWCDEREIFVQVKDDGIGLSEEDITKLFIPFPGIRHGMNVSSTGLGLSISKGIIELHGGRIWAESEGTGKGATFTFTIPILK